MAISISNVQEALKAFGGGQMWQIVFARMRQQPIWKFLQSKKVCRQVYDWVSFISITIVVPITIRITEVALSMRVRKRKHNYKHPCTTSGSIQQIIISRYGTLKLTSKFLYCQITRLRLSIKQLKTYDSQSTYHCTSSIATITFGSVTFIRLEEFFKKKDCDIRSLNSCSRNN